MIYLSTRHNVEIREPQRLFLSSHARAQAMDYFGASVAGIGDVDGDGMEDMVVGALGDDEAALNAGAYLICLNPSSDIALIGTAPLCPFGDCTNSSHPHNSPYVHTPFLKKKHKAPSTSSTSKRATRPSPCATPSRSRAGRAASTPP